MVKVHKFVALDALRGVAALVVLQVHFPELLGSSIFRHGYLAVDFFFMLSGFVLAFAYQQKLDGGLPTLSFLKVRVIRLYPLFLLGMILGLIRMLAQSRPVEHLWGFHLASLLVFGCLMLPVPFPIAGYMAIFPLDLVEWSIFYELVGNIFHALLLRRRGWRLLAAIITVSGVLLVLSVARIGTLDFGAQRSDFRASLFRVTFSYFSGIAIYRVWVSIRTKASVPWFVPVLLLIAILGSPIPSRFLAMEDLLLAMLAFPLVVWLGALSQPPRRLMRLFETLGTSSYAIYVLHMPLASFFARLWGHIRGRAVTLDAPWPGIGFALFMLIVAVALDRFYDMPVRSLLRKRLV